MRFTRLITGSVIAVTAFAAACTDAPTSATPADLLDRGASSVLIPGVNSTPVVEQFKVCKVGSSATFSYTVDSRTNGTGVDESGTVTLQDGECASIAQFGGLGADVSITETSAQTGFQLDRIEINTIVSPVGQCLGTPTSGTVTNTGPTATGHITGSGFDGRCRGITATFYNVPIPPTGGCTRTIGYWKTHAGFTGNNADVVTQYLPISLGTSGGAKSVQVTTATQAVSILSMTGGASNGIVKLMAQLLGAKLSIASGADGSAVTATITAADAFLATKNAADWSSLTNQQRAQVNGWMTTLDNYNNGLSGTAHCE